MLVRLSRVAFLRFVECFGAVDFFADFENAVAVGSMCDANEHELGPLAIDYVKLYSCDMEGWEFVAVFLFLAWTAFLIYLRASLLLLMSSLLYFIVGNTADTYFSPSLGSICEKVKVIMFSLFTCVVKPAL